MKQQKGFIWLILLGLITSCATVKEPPKETIPAITPPTKEEQPTSANTGNDGPVSSSVPQKPFQSVAAMTSSAVAEQWAAPDDKPYVQDYSPQCPSLATLSGVHPDNPPVLAESVEHTPRSAAQQEQLQLAAISDQQAVQYLQQGRFLKALPLAKTAYRVQNEVLGEQHPDSLTSLINLALIYQQLGDFSEAVPLFDKGQRLSQAVLGEQHPITVMLRDNRLRVEQQFSLAQTDKPPVMAYFQPVKATQLSAAPLPKLVKTAYQDKPLLMTSAGRVSTTLSATEKEQLELAKTYGNQMVQYYQQGLFRQALPLAEKAFQIRTEVLGEKHPKTLLSLNNLAMTYKELGRLSKALPLFEKVYRLAQEVLGEKHPDTLRNLNNLAMIYRDLGSLSEALPLFEKGYRLRKEVLGEKHPYTLTSLNSKLGKGKLTR